MVGDLLSIFVKIKSIVKLAKTSYHSLYTSGEFNVPSTSFNFCFNCDAPDHGFDSCHQKKYQKKIAENKNNLINMNQTQCGSRGGKTWAKRSNKKGWTNKTHKQQKINNKENGNLDTKSNNGFHLVDGKCMCLYNKGCGFPKK